VSIRYTLRKVREADLLPELNGEAEPNYENLKRNEMCITETGKVFVRLNDDTIREFTEAAAEYARQILGEVISLRDQVSDIISSASSISDEAVERILDATSEVARMQGEMNEQEQRINAINT